MSFRKVGLLIALLLLGQIVSFGQESNSIKGIVKDQNGAVIPGATVSALNTTGSQKTTVVTNSSGQYQFSNLSSGTYRITALANGFAESAETVTLEAGSPLTQDFTLLPGAIRDVVTVTAGKGNERLAIETPQIITVTTADQIEQRIPRSTLETLERAPNLGSIETNPARERPRLRGLSSNRLLIIVDGEKLNNARSDPGASGAPVSIVDPSQLESVEVVAGSGSSLYGSDSIGGTINLITKRPIRPDTGYLLGLRFDGSYVSNGEIKRGNATLNFSTQKVAFRGSTNLYRNANYNMGNGEVTLAQNVAMGNFFRQFPATISATGAITLQAAASYTIFALPKNAEILNGQGHGRGTQADFWFFPTEKHNIRGRFLGRDDGNNGNAFSGPPYETQERYSSFRKFYKWSARYEGLDLVKYIPRVSVNYFYQEYSFPQNQYTYTNVPGGSFTVAGAAGVFTGNPSVFGSGVAGASFVDNTNNINTDGIDIQATIAPVRGFFFTVGGGRTKDVSQDYFLSSPFAGSAPNRVLTGVSTIGASAPVSRYIDNNFYVQAEFDRVKWVRITAGTRYDKWITKALPGNGFPLSTEFAALNAAIPGLTANPGTLTSLVSSLPELARLTSGAGSVGTNRGSTTYNFGIVGRLPWGINPYFRWANSYREPGITERYLIRNFTPGSFFASLVVGNPNLLPEKGKNYDVGVKIQQRYFNFSLGYFHNEITDLLVFAPAQNYCVAPVPPGLPGSPAAAGFGCTPGQSVVSINARINQAANVIKGIESTAEGSIPLGSFGSLNPYYSLGSLHGTNKSPVPQQIATLNLLYNRTDTPIRLTGSLDDFPLANITPFRFLGGVQYLDNNGRFFVEYNVRHQNRVTRADPNQFVGTALINFGSFANTNSFDKHTLKGGFNWKNEDFKFSVNAGIDNIADKLYWEHFQNAPAPGRSFLFGFTIEAFNLLKKK